jgi:phenylpropionate dioxygenase-like ring-hydroxylating dioxygenase large terminal subunit
MIMHTQDPTHVPVSHHGIAGNRNTDPEPIRMTVVRPLTADGGVSFLKESALYTLKVYRTHTLYVTAVSLHHWYSQHV